MLMHEKNMCDPYVLLTILNQLTKSKATSCKLDWNKVKYARITITHVCFIALTLAGSLG